MLLISGGPVCARAVDWNRFFQPRSQVATISLIPLNPFLHPPTKLVGFGGEREGIRLESFSFNEDCPGTICRRKLQFAGETGVVVLANEDERGFPVLRMDTWKNEASKWGSKLAECDGEEAFRKFR